MGSHERPRSDSSLSRHDRQQANVETLTSDFPPTYDQGVVAGWVNAVTMAIESICDAKARPIAQESSQPCDNSGGAEEEAGGEGAWLTSHLNSIPWKDQITGILKLIASRNKNSG